MAGRAGLVGLATIAEEQGDFATAVQLLEESSSYFALTGDLISAALNGVDLGVIAHDQGRLYARARELIGRELALFERCDDQRAFWSMLERLRSSPLA